jgi:hypothetical protein
LSKSQSLLVQFKDGKTPYLPTLNLVSDVFPCDCCRVLVEAGGSKCDSFNCVKLEFWLMSEEKKGGE